MFYAKKIGSTGNGGLKNNKMSQGDIINYLEKRGEATIKEMTKHLRLTRAVVSKNCQTLAKHKEVNIRKKKVGPALTYYFSLSL